MRFIKCKNEKEKIQAIKDYCNENIKEYNKRIAWFEAEKSSILDYRDEIDELKTRIAHFEKIIEIINADEYTSIMIL